MDIEASTYRKLTNKEKEEIEKITSRAEKRKHITIYNPDFIVTHLLESYKEWDYDSKEDAIDMLDAIFEVAEKCKVMTPKQIAKERKYKMKEYVNQWFEDEDE